jgi:hypothetical protein
MSNNAELLGLNMELLKTTQAPEPTPVVLFDPNERANVYISALTDLGLLKANQDTESRLETVRGMYDTLHAELVGDLASYPTGTQFNDLLVPLDGEDISLERLVALFDKDGQPKTVFNSELFGAITDIHKRSIGAEPRVRATGALAMLSNPANELDDRGLYFIDRNLGEQTADYAKFVKNQAKPGTKTTVTLHTPIDRVLLNAQRRVEGKAEDRKLLSAQGWDRYIQHGMIDTTSGSWLPSALADGTRAYFDWGRGGRFDRRGVRLLGGVISPILES